MTELPLWGGSGRYRFCLFCGVSGLFLRSPALLKAMNVDAISARVDNDGTNMVKRIKIGRGTLAVIASLSFWFADRRDCPVFLAASRAA